MMVCALHVVDVRMCGTTTPTSVRPACSRPGTPTASTSPESESAAPNSSPITPPASVMVCSSGQVVPLCEKVRTLPGPAETPLSGTAAAATATRVPLMATARPKAPPALDGPESTACCDHVVPLRVKT